MKTGAVILAAGAPGEIKEGKPMMCVGQKPMIRHIVDTLTELKLSPVVVVTGYRSDIIERCLASTGAVIVRNRKFASTDMFCSLQARHRGPCGELRQSLCVPGGPAAGEAGDAQAAHGLLGAAGEARL